MIQPVNSHLLIEPIKHEGFISSSRETFEEIGIVKAFAEGITALVKPNGNGKDNDVIEVGDKVYFDSWLAAKFPDGKDGFLWFVKWEDVRAVEKNEQVPEQ